MNLKNYLTIALVSAVFALNAQIIFQEDFSGGLPAGWTNVDGTSNAGEEVTFVHTTDPDAVAPAALGNTATATFLATGASDGYLWANSDRGLASAPAALHTTELTTTAIDCSMAADVFFSMQALIGVFELDAVDNCVLRVSTDAGTTWTSFTMFPNLTTAVRWSDNPFLISADISSVAAGQSNVLLQVQWTGGWEYFMAIDDMELTSEDPRPANNVRVNQFAAIAPNVQTPYTQVEPIGFIADIENIGADDQTNVQLTISVVDDANGSEVFTSTLDYGTITSDSLAENVFFPDEFTPTAAVGSYTATYSLSYDNIADEADPDNASRSFPIIITDSVFSKALDATRSVAPAADNSFSYGNVYWVNNTTDPATGDPLLAKSVTFGMQNPDAIPGQSLTVFLYEWDGDTNENGSMDPDDGLNNVGFASYEVEGGEGQALITVPLESLFSDVIELQADKYYFATLEYTDNTETAFFMLASEEFDYAAMNFYTDSLDRARYGGALYIPGVIDEGTFSLAGFGLDIVPVVRLNIGVEDIVDATEPQLPTGAVKTFPNPADAFVNVDFDLEEQTSGDMTLFNSKGQILQVQALENVLSDRIQVNTANLPSGTYFIRISTDLGVSHRVITVQH